MSRASSPVTAAGQGSIKSNTINVVCRYRPLNNKELHEGGEHCLKILGDDLKSAKSVQLESLDETRQIFSFDGVLGEESTQQEVYDLAAASVVQEVLTGKNGCLLAYGQTGSGKTHTMSGVDKTPGIIPRVIDSIFQFALQADPTVEFTVAVTFVEIYNETIRDLLSDRKNLNLVNNGSGGVKIIGCEMRYVTSSQEMHQVMDIGSKNRAVGATGMNAGSSRSHSIFSISIEQLDMSTGEKLASNLVLVDLAGSEMVKKTQATGSRLNEAKSINKSLSALGNVINALTDERSERTHVPYRDSKLTRLLEDNLGGNSVTTLIICCSPSSSNDYETLSTLRFGKRAKNIKNRAQINKHMSAAELQKRVRSLEKEVKESHTRETKAMGLLERALEKIAAVKQETGGNEDSENDGMQPSQQAHRKMDSVTLPLPSQFPPTFQPSSANDEKGNDDEKAAQRLAQGALEVRITAEQLEAKLAVVQKDYAQLQDALESEKTNTANMYAKIVSDSEVKMAMQMRLDDLEHQVAALLQDAPQFLKSSTQLEIVKRKRAQAQYSSVLAINEELRREVDVLEGLTTKYQNELVQLRIQMSRKNVSSAERNCLVGEHDDFSNAVMHDTSPPRFKRSLRGGSAATGVSSSTLPKHEVVIKNRSCYEHKVPCCMGTTVCWEWQCTSHDIGFHVVYGSKNIRAYIRGERGSGRFTPTDNEATFVTLRFDNSYSIFRDKKVWFVVSAVEQPRRLDVSDIASDTDNAVFTDNADVSTTIDSVKKKSKKKKKTKKKVAAID